MLSFILCDAAKLAALLLLFLSWCEEDITAERLNYIVSYRSLLHFSFYVLELQFVVCTAETFFFFSHFASRDVF